MSELDLLRPCLAVIGSLHGFRLASYKVSVRVGGLEVDAVAYYSTPSGQERAVIIELKETDFSRLADQLIARKHLGNYVYGCIALQPYLIMESVWWLNMLLALRTHGIGLITCPNGYPQILLRAKYHKRLEG